MSCELFVSDIRYSHLNGKNPSSLYTNFGVSLSLLFSKRVRFVGDVIRRDTRELYRCYFLNKMFRLKFSVKFSFFRHCAVYLLKGEGEENKLPKSCGVNIVLDPCNGSSICVARNENKVPQIYSFANWTKSIRKP